MKYLYGEIYFNNGDTTYSFNFGNFFGGANERNETNGIKQTIWDAGGIDTLDFSAMPANPPGPALSALGNNVVTPAPPRVDGYYLDMNEGGQLTTLYALNRATYLVPSTTDNQNPENPTPPAQYNTSRFNTSIAFGSEIENLVGSPANDVILGNTLANNISGGAGDDNITGAAGPDVLTGGPGNDTFVFARGDGGPTPEAGDTVIDFRKDGQDKIGLTVGLPFRTLPQPINVIPTNANRKDIRFTQSGELLGTLTRSATNGNDTLLQLISTNEYLAVLKDTPIESITANDFVAL